MPSPGPLSFAAGTRLAHYEIVALLGENMRRDALQLIGAQAPAVVEEERVVKCRPQPRRALGRAASVARRYSPGPVMVLPRDRIVR